MRFEIIGGPEDGNAVSIDKERVVIGREAGDDVSLYYDNIVSRHHAVIAKRGEGYFVRDSGSKGEGSSHGTYLLTEKGENCLLRNEERPIGSGNILCIGRIRIKFLG